MTSLPPSALPPAAPLSPEDQRLWATLIHLGGIVFGALAALIGYLVLKDRGAFVREHTAQALNFQLTMLIASVVSGVLVLLIIGIFLLLTVAVLVIVFSILAAIAANSGQPYRYPLSIPFIS